VHVSVVVPSYRRPESLSRCLNALLRQDTQPDEILVVVRREDEASRRCVRERREKSIRCVPIEVPAGRPGAVAALNAGVDASQGEIVCLTDDDAEPHPDWISRIVAAFDADPMIGAVGGRDWIYHDGRLEDEAADTVGMITRWGRVIGNHHLGVGPARSVAVLKGVNLSVRGDLIRQVRFDTRLLGRTTEHHSELGLCFRLLRMGFRVVYDPATVVDHRPVSRVGETREFDSSQVRDAAHNETLALLEHLTPVGRMAHLFWTTVIGTRNAPGLAQAARLLLSTRDAKLEVLFGNLTGRGLAVLTYLGLSNQKAHPARNAPQGSGASADAHNVLAIAHSSSAGARAEQLLERIPGSRVIQPSRDARGMAWSAWMAFASRAKVLYLVDVGKTTAPAALVGRLTGKRVIVDTGDACFALARSLGDRNFVGLLVVGVAEKVALRSAQEVVVRGRSHASLVAGRVAHIPDIPPTGVGPVSGANVRTMLGIDHSFVVGLVGSLTLSRRHRISYGWDLIEALAYTSPEVVALIVGDGSGLETLRGRARELAVEDRCRFVGRVPTERISEYVCAADVGLSTQSNDQVGRVRTTGKLPLYLACGRPVLASHVGEAARLLGPLGWTLPYDGVVDPNYPHRLAGAIGRWRRDPDGAPHRQANAIRIAREAFDLEIMRRRAADVIAGPRG
jgi:GT2 family glycosyltransferase